MRIQPTLHFLLLALGKYSQKFSSLFICKLRNKRKCIAVKNNNSMLMILKSKKGIKEPSEGKGQVIRQSREMKW